MPFYKIHCTWTVESTITVEAENQTDALDQAYELPTDKFPRVTYVDDTFSVAEVTDSDATGDFVPRP